MFLNFDPLKPLKSFRTIVDLRPNSHELQPSSSLKFWHRLFKQVVKIVNREKCPGQKLKNRQKRDTLFLPSQSFLNQVLGVPQVSRPIRYSRKFSRSSVGNKRPTLFYVRQPQGHLRSRCQGQIIRAHSDLRQLEKYRKITALSSAQLMYTIII